MMRKITLSIAIVTLLLACQEEEKTALIHDLNEFKAATENIQPGTVLTLANGEWSDVELRLEANGTAEKPVILKAETPGKVFITGQSNLAFSGSFIEISGLVFKQGYTPTSEVISFKTSKTKLANNCLLSHCVIDNFSNPERFDSDTWVAIYGKNNRIENNSFIGKGNNGVTMAVKLSSEESRENGHLISRNYFGPRQVLGSNGGETLRIGTSHFSRTYSNTKVTGNYFDRTNGEHEIISNKSCGNEFKDNVFFECQGTLTMRHGHHTLVENNYFLGNRKANTGGIRIINENQTVQKNYLDGLTGHRFRGALVIMNGVPNSPINRYNQVVDSEMRSNIVLRSDFIQLCAGSDEERSAVPIGTSFTDNMLVSKSNLEPFTIYDDVSGITFKNNLMNEEATLPLSEGFSSIPYQLSRNENDLWSPAAEQLDKIGFQEIKLPITKAETGAEFYIHNTENANFWGEKTTKVEAGTNTLLAAIAASEDGDILELQNGGSYLLTKYAFVNKALKITCPAGEKAQIFSEKQSFFKIENGGALHFANVTFDGAESPDHAGNNVISTSKYAMNENYFLVLEDCEVLNLDKNHSFDFLKSYRHTFADSIVIRNSLMSNITGSVMGLDHEVEDLGIYNVENVIIENSNFIQIQGAIVNVYRGGTDESTFGPIVKIQQVEISECGQGKRNKVEASLRFHGVQKLQVSDLQLRNSAKIDLFLTNGEPITTITNVELENTQAIRSNSDDYISSNVIYLN